MRTRRSICLKKARFRSENEAVLAVQAASITLRHYRCDRCGQFHLTSRTKGKRVSRPGGVIVPGSDICDEEQWGCKPHPMVPSGKNDGH